jgi:5-methylcytosine-specific restriction endonuclease McrA
MNIREIKRIRSAEWLKANPERAKANRKAYYEAHKEEAKRAARLWRCNNAERNRFNSSLWKKNNPDEVRVMASKRRALKINVEGEFTASEFLALGSMCLCCGRSDVPMTADHVIPLTKGGSNNIDNIQPLCGPCNSTKHDKIIDYRKAA